MLFQESQWESEDFEFRKANIESADGKLESEKIREGELALLVKKP